MFNANRANRVANENLNRPTLNKASNKLIINGVVVSAINLQYYRYLALDNLNLCARDNYKVSKVLRNQRQIRKRKLR